MIELEHKLSIIKIITAFYPDAKIYLFGSYLKGKPHEESDIDIAIVFNDFENKILLPLSHVTRIHEQTNLPVQFEK